jgi:hypothetical protein
MGTHKFDIYTNIFHVISKAQCLRLEDSGNIVSDRLVAVALALDACVGENDFILHDDQGTLLITPNTFWRPTESTALFCNKAIELWNAMNEESIELRSSLTAKSSASISSDTSQKDLLYILLEMELVDRTELENNQLAALNFDE